MRHRRGAGLPLAPREADFQLTLRESPSLDDLRQALERHTRVYLPPLPGRTNHLDTAVLVPLVWGPDPECIITVRASHLRYHGGEPCFPGGRPDADDADLKATAVREAHEELGIEPGGVTVLGELSSVPLYTSDYRLHPFVAAIPPQPLTPNRDEVAHVLRVRLRDVLDLPQIHAIAWTHERIERLAAVFEIGDHRVYGGTAHVFHELLVVCAPLLGRAVPPLQPGKYDWPDVLNPRSFEA